jgi:hypothetical protein
MEEGNKTEIEQRYKIELEEHKTPLDEEKNYIFRYSEYDILVKFLGEY